MTEQEHPQHAHHHHHPTTIEPPVDEESDTAPLLPESGDVDASDVRPGYVLLSRHLLLEELGSGSYGRVFSALDMHDGRQVAVKFSFGTGRRRSRNLFEAHVLSRLVASKRSLRRGAIALHSYHVTHDCVVLVMDRFRQSLDELLDGGEDLTFPELSRFAGDVVSFLRLTYEEGIIHGDVKPENILIDEGNEGNEEEGERGEGNGEHVTHRSLRFIDFGLAQYSSSSDRFKVVQTLWYRAPEVTLGLRYDESADAWSAGCVLVECSTHLRLFQANSDLELLRQVSAVLGHVPQSMARESPRRSELFDHDWKTNRWLLRGLPADLKPIGLRRYLNDHLLCYRRGADDDPRKDDEEEEEECRRARDDFVCLIRRMICLEPRARAKPSELMGHPFVVRYSGRDGGPKRHITS